MNNTYLITIDSDPETLTIMTLNHSHSPDENLIAYYGSSPLGMVILIETDKQTLSLYQSGCCLQMWNISTASRGTGNQTDSLQTPLGAHRIAEKIGAGSPVNTIFKARQDSGQQAAILDQPCSSGQDLITSRILWLRGIEEGKNLNGQVDTFQRYIYIHGTPEEGLIGQPVSHGCIRMRNDDIIQLFGHIETDTLVYISH